MCRNSLVALPNRPTRSLSHPLAQEAVGGGAAQEVVPVAVTAVVPAPVRARVVPAPVREAVANYRYGWIPHPEIKN
jgi:hypothetical protein